MKKHAWKTYAFWILFTEAVGALAGFLSKAGMELYKTHIIKPPLSPPAILFPIVWAILYALMGFGAARIWLAPRSTDRTFAVRFAAAGNPGNFKRETGTPRKRSTAGSLRYLYHNLDPCRIEGTRL